MSEPRPPHPTYSDRLARHRDDLAILLQRERRLSWGRLGCVVAALALLWIGVDTGLFSGWWSVLPVAVFVVLVVYHERCVRRRVRAERAVRFNERALERLEDRWHGRGATGADYRVEAHLYADDLDLFGRGSLFELLCLARTRAGEATLAEWLLHPAPPDVVQARQGAVRALRERIDFREDLAVLGDDVRAGLEPTALLAWSEAPPRLAQRWAGAAAALLVLATGASLVGAALGWTSGLPFLLAASAEAAFTLYWRSQVREVLRDVERPTRDLRLLEATLRRIEAEPLEDPRLLSLQGELTAGGQRASESIEALRRIIDRLDARKNELFAPIAALLLWGTQSAFAVERWRRRGCAAVGRWLAVVGEVEALHCLAAYSFENPDHVFPEWSSDSPSFTAADLGHPLLPATCVRNDVHLGADRRVLLVSGSNMSGKSTLLRSVGLATVMAQAGAPVRARRLQLSPLAVAASMRIVDSLQTGTSHFYAEIRRLRQVVEQTQAELPVLFLLDEILHGTNSHDRRIGAAAVVRALVGYGAVGLVTTHDLALAAIGDDPALRGANVHFEDRMEEGVMVFDYRMRDGVVRHSNALALMRSVGLEVGDGST